MLRIIPLGGLGEVGKNMTVYELGDEIIVVDAGLAFPRDEHLGVDLLLPDIGYLEGRRVRAVVLTHGHEDHVGGLPYLLREVEVDAVVATPLTLALVKSKLDEHGLGQKSELVAAEPGDEPLELGPFRIELVRVAHSIPDSAALVIETSAGRVVHTGDWKLDHTPVDGLKTDVGTLAEIGNRGVDLLLGDSTNAERPGNTGSERLVGEAFRSIFPLRKGKILVASFASNIHRMQQAADVAVECGRKVVVVGRSMRKNLNIARNLGYVSFPEDAIVNPDEAAQLPAEQLLVLCTGSQGEPMSALTRIAYGDHKAVSVEPGDTVMISAKPVPGNELRVHDSINQLARAGAEVLHEEIAPVHVSGHACQEELRTMLSLLRPRHVMPIHGEYRMLAAHAKLAREAGVPEERILIAENGSVVELARGGARLVDKVRRGRDVRRRPPRRGRQGRRASRPPPARRRRRPHRRHDARVVGRRRDRAAGAHRARLRRLGRAPRRAARRGGPRRPRARVRARDGDQAPPGAHPRRRRPDRLRPHAPPTDDSAGGDRGMSWVSVIEGNAASELTARRLVSQLRACEAASLAFCRLLERWGRGDAVPATPGARQAALRHAADRVETALAGLERPLSQYLLELEPELAEGRSWYAGPGAGELVEWQPVLDRAGVRVCPNRVAAVYLELAVLVRASGRARHAQPRMDAAPDRSSLWAGLFDLRDTLLGSTVDDLRALAA